MLVICEKGFLENDTVFEKIDQAGELVADRTTFLDRPSCLGECVAITEVGRQAALV